MKKKGFTLTEMISVIVIVGIVIIIAIPASRRMILNNQQNKTDEKQRIFEKAIIAYSDVEAIEYNCVSIPIDRMLAYGYIKDLSNLDYTNSDIVYYDKINGTISKNENICSTANSEHSGNDSSEDYDDVSVPKEQIQTYTYTLTVTRTTGDYISGLDFSPVITLTAGDKTVSTTNNQCDVNTLYVSYSCSISVPENTKVSYEIIQDYYKMSSGSKNGEVTINSDQSETKNMTLNKTTLTFQYKKDFYETINNKKMGNTNERVNMFHGSCYYVGLSGSRKVISYTLKGGNGANASTNIYVWVGGYTTCDSIGYTDKFPITKVTGSGYTRNFDFDVAPETWTMYIYIFDGGGIGMKTLDKPVLTVTYLTK